MPYWGCLVLNPLPKNAEELLMRRFAKCGLVAEIVSWNQKQGDFCVMATVRYLHGPAFDFLTLVDPDRIKRLNGPIDLTEERKKDRRKIAEWMKVHNLTVGQTAVALKKPASAIYDIAKEFGVKAPSGYCKAASLNSFKILKALLSGRAQAEVAREMSVSAQRVGQIAQRAREAGFEV